MALRENSKIHDQTLTKLSALSQNTDTHKKKTDWS